MSHFFNDGLELPELSYYDALTVSSRAFGTLGENSVRLWRQYNMTYFEGRLKPVPVLYVPTSHYGGWVGLCAGSKKRRVVHHIWMMLESPLSRPWALLRTVLLHEMVHQSLIERGLSADHAGLPWREVIMRLSFDHFGVQFWAGESTVVKRRNPDGKRQSVRTNRASPNGEPSLTQGEIARWPDSMGIIPPDLD